MFSSIAAISRADRCSTSGTSSCLRRLARLCPAHQLFILQAFVRGVLVDQQQLIPRLSQYVRLKRHADQPKLYRLRRRTALDF